MSAADPTTLVAAFRASQAREVAAREAISAEARERRRIVSELHAGRSLAEVAVLLGVSRARVHQLLKPQM